MFVVLFSASQPNKKNIYALRSVVWRWCFVKLLFAFVGKNKNHIFLHSPDVMSTSSQITILIFSSLFSRFFLNRKNENNLFRLNKQLFEAEVKSLNGNITRNKIKRTVVIMKGPERR